MKNNYQKEEQFLRVLANAYITHDARELLCWLPDDFGYDSMWVTDSIKTKDRYKKYISGKLAAQKRELYNIEFGLTKTVDDGKPVLLIMNVAGSDKQQGAFVATSDKNGNITRLDLTAANFYKLEPVSDENIIKRTYKTLLDTLSNCGMSYFNWDGTVQHFKGVIVNTREGHDAAWGLAYLDDIPDDFCMVYDYRKDQTVRMFTKDTKIPVDFIFVGNGGQIIKIHKNAEPLSTDIITCEHVWYVIEVKAGQCDKNRIVPLGSLRINSFINAPHPEKCDDLIYEDENMTVKKVWDCHKKSIYIDKNDDSNLVFYNWDATIFIDLDGNEVYRDITEWGQFEGEWNKEGIKPIYKDGKWYFVDKKKNRTFLDRSDILQIKDVGEGLFRINTKRITNLAFKWWHYEPGLYGYIDGNGHEIVEPKYIWAEYFSETDHRAIVCAGKWETAKRMEDGEVREVTWSNQMLFGMIDTEGNEVVPCKFDEIRRIAGCTDKYFAHTGGFKNTNIARDLMGMVGKWGVIDAAGNWIVEPMFENCPRSARGNVIRIDDPDNKGFYDIVKKEYLSFDKDYSSPYFASEDGLIYVTEFDEKLGYDVEKLIDFQGKELFPSKYSGIGDEDHGRRKVWIEAPEDEEPKDEEINDNETDDDEEIYEDEDYYDEDDGNRYGIIDSKGHEIIPCVYNRIGDISSDKMFSFCENRRWGISDYNRHILVQPKYTYLNILDDYKLAEVRDLSNHGRLYGIITTDGKVVLPMKYDAISLVKDNHILCRMGAKTEMFKVTLKK